MRSSAIDEDGDHQSFAGQLDSFLQIDRTAVVEKVLAVWRSAFSSRALAYRQEHHLTSTPTPPAVLIQRMVEAEAAGVAFGADPLSGKRSIVVVNAVAGLADRLVAGECEANTYQVDRSGQILQRQEIAGEQAVLTDAQIQAIAHLTRQAGHYYGQPQDIEWAWANQHLFLLQSRPITTLTHLPDPDATFSLWDNSNIVESYNGVTTPLTFSFARKAYEEVYKQFCYFMGVPLSAIAQHQHVFRCMIGFIQGRIYYNLLSWYRMLALLPGARLNARFMEQMMGVRETLPERVILELQQAMQQNSLQDGWRLLTTGISLITNFFTLPARIRRYYKRLDRALQLDGFATRPANMTDWRADELVAHYRALEQDLLAHWDAPLITDFFAMIFYGLLRRCTERWCGDVSGTLQNDLIGGEGGVISTEPMRAMQAMARLISDRPESIAILCQAPLLEILQWMAKFPDFQQQYQAYLERFGDRCLEELKLESTTLHDDPLPLLRTVGQLASHPHTQADEHDNTPAQMRKRAEQRIQQALAGHPLRQMILGWVLQQARIQVRNRENLRFERTRVFGRARRIFIELGRRLHQIDRLQQPEDVFYLEVNEILGFVEGNLTCTDLKGLVQLRQAEFARYRQQPAPSDRFETYGIVYQGNSFHRAVSSTNHASTAPLAANERQGVGCAPGKVSGVVRVITHSKQVLEQTDRPLQPGSILVAESTDPGWILLFPHAAGLLVARGSLLSHVAIVARELGIPMITSLPGVTEWLKDGELIELDSNTGRVQKLSTIHTAAGAEPCSRH